MPYLARPEFRNAFEANVRLAALEQVRSLVEREVGDWKLAGLDAENCERLRLDLRQRYAIAGVARRVAHHGGLGHLALEMRRFARRLIEGYTGSRER